MQYVGHQKKSNGTLPVSVCHLYLEFGLEFHRHPFLKDLSQSPQKPLHKYDAHGCLQWGQALHLLGLVQDILQQGVSSAKHQHLR